MSEAKKDDKKPVMPVEGDAVDPKFFTDLRKRIDELEKLCAAAPGDEDFKRLRDRLDAVERMARRPVDAAPELRFDVLPSLRNKEWHPSRDGEYLMLRSVPKPSAPGVNVRDGEYKSLPCGVKLVVPQGYLAAVGQIINFGGAHQVQNIVYVSPGHTSEIEVMCTCPRGKRDYFPTPGDVIGIAWLVPAPKFTGGGTRGTMLAPQTDDKPKA